MRWYRTYGRHELPWRLTRDPYAVLVSEFMLQQTQVERVVPYYLAWMERWRSFPQLSDAATADVIAAWGGLGYNRRAVNLQRTARIVTEERGGRLPRTETGLRALPGVGTYTAAAVRSFAFGEPTSVVDTNVGRVLARAVEGVASMHGAGAAAVAASARELLPGRGVRDHNLAFMDLGAVVCRASKPACDTCPLIASCRWREIGSPPEQARATQPVRFEDTARFARGRIVAALRSGAPMTTDELSGALTPAHRARTASYLAALEHDGLVEQTHGGRWQLPGAVRREAGAE